MKLIPTLALLSLIYSHPAWALDRVYNESGVAIRGYDPVAYFTLGQAVRGRPNISYQWMNFTWRFANQVHLDTFKAAPERYAPQYAGYCAYAVSKGSTAPVDPTAWTINKDKVYLNFSHSVRERWRQDIEANIAKADRNWPRLKAM